MANENPKGPVALNMGREAEERFARQQRAARRAEEAAKPREAGTLGVVGGELANVEERQGRNGPYLRGSFTYDTDGVSKTVVALVNARAMEKAGKHFVNGPVRLYGEMRPDAFSIIGPEIAKRSPAARKSVRATAKTAAVIADPAGTAPKANGRGWWFAKKAAERKAIAA